jgi:probable HAF family extracellular repeat protein
LNKSYRTISAVGIAALTALAPAALASPQYSVTEVPDEALAITNSGTVLTGSGIWISAGGPQTPPWTPPGMIQNWGINNAGAIVGTTNVGTVETAVIWQNGTVTALPSLPLGSEVFGQAYGVNDSGVVVGYSETSPARLRAVSWTNGIAEDLGNLLGAAGVNSFARGVNDAGQIIVDSNPNAAPASVPNGVSFLINGNAITPVTDNNGVALGVNAWAINANGVVAGAIYLADGTAHAFTWANGTMNVAPQAPSPTPGLDGASAINDQGVVVGDSRTNQTSAEIFPFIWDGDSAPINLNDLIDPASGWELDSAWGINDSGQIVGNGELNGIGTGFLLTPTASPSIPTPEPTTLPLLLTAALPLLRRHPRKSP